MLTKDIRTCWPALRDDVSDSYCAKALVHTPISSAPAARGDAVTGEIYETHVNTPPAQVAPASGQATTPDGHEHLLAGKESSTAVSHNKQITFISVADVIARALAAGTTGAMENVADVAPPPPAHPTGSSVATAAPVTTTFHTATTSAAAEALKKAELTTEYDTDSDTGEEAAAAGSDGEAAADKTDGDMDSHGVLPLFPVNNFWTYASMSTSMPAAYAQGSTFAGASLQAGGFTLRPAVWTDVDQAMAEDDDNDVSMASDDD